MIIKFADYYESEFFDVICDKMTMRQINGAMSYVCQNEKHETVQIINSHLYHIIEILSYEKEIH